MTNGKTRPIHLCVIVLLVLAWPAAALAADDWPRTPYEISGGKATPRHAETVAWLGDLAARSPLLQAGSFGTSPRGRDLQVIVADATGRFTAAEHADRTDHAVVLLQACIHAGESNGKDAGMILLRDLAAGAPHLDGLLDNTTFVFIPIFNVDGHERFGPHGRINQDGPEEMGWRVTARNQNLNRDYMKADTPEMQAWLALFDAWRPDFFIDAHATNGADYQYVMTYSLELQGNMDAGLTAWAAAYEEAMNERMLADGIPMAPYVSFRRWHDPASGMRNWAATPRFSQGYTALQNRPGLLVETHMLKPYHQRVEATLALVTHTLRWCGDNAAELNRLVRSADAHAASAAFRAQPFPLSFRSDGDSVIFEFQGIEYEKVTSEVTGGEWNRFTGKPVTMQMPFFKSLEPAATATLPEVYLVPPEWHEAFARLDAHGIAYTRLEEPREVEVRSYVLTDPSWQERSYEGHHPVSFTATPWAGTRIYPPGTAVVDMNQRAARVAAHLLEPEGPDSLVRWGFFDAIFERVEYVESYVIEEMIPDLLAENPAWAAELEAAKAADPEFAADPWAIRYWFYARTPYYDDRIGHYPVGMLDSADGLR